MLEDVVERAFGDVLPLVLWARQSSADDGRRNGGVTDDEKYVGILRLHARCDTRIFVAGKILCIDDGDDRVEREGTLSFALEFADLKCEGGGEGGTASREWVGDRV